MVKVGKCYINQLEVDADNYFFAWEINDFDKVPAVAEHPITSPSFILGERSDTVWQLLISKENEEEKKKDSYSSSYSRKKKIDEKPIICSKCSEMRNPDVKNCSICYLKKLSIGFRLTKVEDSSMWEVVHYKVTLKANLSDKEESEMIYIDDKECTDTGNSFYETSINNLIIGKDMSDEEVLLFTAKKLKIEVVIQHSFVEVNPLRIASECKLVEAMKDLYKSKKFADVIVKAGDFETEVHKNLLCAKAYGIDGLLQEDPDVLKPTLELNLEESVTNAMLSFIYCSGLPIEFPLSKCPALYSVAKQYEVVGLAQAVKDFLKGILPSETCLESVYKMFGLDPKFDESGENLVFQKLVDMVLECDEQKMETVIATKKCTIKKQD